MQCVHCEKKIGLFKKPIEGIYCSADCSNAARVEQARQAKEAEQRALEQARLDSEADGERAHSGVIAKAARELLGQCPKCSHDWKYVPGAGSAGLDVGECGHCGFTAEFLAIEACENCRTPSMVVRSEHDARCPKCKSRPNRSRQSA